MKFDQNWIMHMVCIQIYSNKKKRSHFVCKINQIFTSLTKSCIKNLSSKQNKQIYSYYVHKSLFSYHAYGNNLEYSSLKFWTTRHIKLDKTRLETLKIKIKNCLIYTSISNKD